MQPEPISTPITRMLGIRYPILVAPMFLVSNPPLLEAVGRAGAIGAIPALNFRTTALYAQFLAGFPPELPFGVNIILKESARLEADLDATVARKVPWVVTSLGDPTAVAQAVHAYGGKVFCDVISLRHAEKAARAGADALIAVSAGAGGHAGPLSPFVLGPWLSEELGLPVVLAGGLANGQHLAAALALGAGAGYFGTRFIASHESAAPDAYKAALVAASPEGIELTAEVTGVQGNFLTSSLERVRTSEAKAWKEVWSAGHSVAFVRDVLNTEALVHRIAAEYHAAVSALPR